jgi:hypothetical protein
MIAGAFDPETLDQTVIAIPLLRQPQEGVRASSSRSATN